MIGFADNTDIMMTNVNNVDLPEIMIMRINRLKKYKNSCFPAASNQNMAQYYEYEYLFHNENRHNV